MASLTELRELAEELGLTGNEAVTFIREQQDIARKQRHEQREEQEAIRAHEREQQEANRAHEIRVLELRATRQPEVPSHCSSHPRE